MVRKPFYGILLILAIALVGAIGGSRAQGQPGSSFGEPVMYEAVWLNDSEAEATLSSLEANVPEGSAYVGLAAGSQVGSEAQRVDGRLIWEGPFNLPPGGELVLRYWLAPTSPGLQAPPMEITAVAPTSEPVQTSAQPIEAAPSELSMPEDITAPEAVAVSKTAENPEIPPGGEPWVLYSVVFTNSSASAAALDQISDTLAQGFWFVGMAYGSDIVVEPVDPRASTLVWQGPFTVPGAGTLELRYWVKASGTPGSYVNTVQAVGGGITVGPDTATVTILGPDLSLDVDASPIEVPMGGTVTFDVTLSNSGNAPGVISVISDTLSSGLTFLGMDPNSDIPDSPVPSNGSLIWTGSFLIPAGDESHLIYQARAGTVGTETNSVTARDEEDNLLGPVGAEITVSPLKVSLPLLLSRFGTAGTLPMNEEFTTSIPPEWTPFVNYRELDPRDWYYVGDRSTWGRYDFNATEPLSQWALSMYLGEDAEEWTDYKIETRFRAGKEWPSTPKLVGVWFRGTHELRTDNQGGDVTGYMFILKPDKDPAYAKAYIGHIDPNTRKLGFVKDFERQFTNYAYTFYNVKIEVRGANIQVWVDGTQIINWTDPNATWQRGTVGFVVYQGTAAFDYIRVSRVD